jgi:exonuclease SbcD
MAATSPFRVLHTADWHLGKMLGDLSRESEHQRFLDLLLDEIVARDVDALLIAGDIFDSSNPPQSAITQYYNFLSELHRRSHCHVVVIAGNHDSPAQIEAPRQLLQLLRTHVVGQWHDDSHSHLIPLPDATAPRIIIAAIPFLRDRDVRVGISGQTPAEIQATLNAAITAIYQEVATAAKIHNVPIIAMGHLTVTGASTSDSEREIHIGGLGALPAQNFPNEFAYVALGHLHRPQACGALENIRYSGSPIPLSFSEANDKKEMRLLEIQNDGIMQQTGIAIPLTRRLVQRKCKSADIETCLQQLRVELSNELLPSWVELTLIDAIVGDGMTAKIQELTRDAPFEIIRILHGTASQLAQAMAEFESHSDEIDTRLNQPEAIFALRLEQAESLTEEQKTSLHQHFHALLALHRGE